MSGATAFFIIFSAVIALCGLLAAGFGQGYLQFFGFVLMLFGVLFAFNCIKRHFDRADAARAAQH